MTRALLLFLAGCATWEPTPTEALRREAQGHYEFCRRAYRTFGAIQCRKDSEAWCLAHGLERDCGQDEFATRELR